MVSVIVSPWLCRRSKLKVNNYFDADGSEGGYMFSSQIKRCVMFSACDVGTSHMHVQHNQISDALSLAVWCK